MASRGRALGDVGAKLRVLTAVGKHTRNYGPLTVHDCFRTLLKRFWNAIRAACFLLVMSELIAVTQRFFIHGFGNIVPGVSTPVLAKHSKSFQARHGESAR